MAKYVPHYENWHTIAKWRKAASITFYTGFTLSVIGALRDYSAIGQFVAEHPTWPHYLSVGLNSLTILILLASLFIDLVVTITYHQMPRRSEELIS